jgi:hypothetical protein
MNGNVFLWYHRANPCGARVLPDPCPLHSVPLRNAPPPGTLMCKGAVTFITFCSGSNYMHDVVSSRKMENGIVVFWEEDGEKTYESFNYLELIDMKINALDLLERPKSYKVDKDAHTLIVKK